jgi:hypothetical protein
MRYKEQYFEVSHRFEALHNLEAEAYINSAWETSRETIKMSVKVEIMK